MTDQPTTHEHDKTAEKPSLPRYLHKALQPDKLVSNAAEYDKAKGEGYGVEVPAVKLYKDDEEATVYSLEALTYARAQGWRTKAAHDKDDHDKHEPRLAIEDEKAKPKR